MKKLFFVLVVNFLLYPLDSFSQSRFEKEFCSENYLEKKVSSKDIIKHYEMSLSMFQRNPQSTFRILILNRDSAVAMIDLKNARNGKGSGAWRAFRRFDYADELNGFISPDYETITHFLAYMINFHKNNPKAKRIDECNEIDRIRNEFKNIPRKEYIMLNY